MDFIFLQNSVEAQFLFILKKKIDPEIKSRRKMFNRCVFNHIKLKLGFDILQNDKIATYYLNVLLLTYLYVHNLYKKINQNGWTNEQWFWFMMDSQLN